jgi:CheY-like chemotaxis protein
MPNVLVVEDDPHVRLLLERLVEGCGYGVLSAGSGSEALAVLADGGAEVDLLLTDLMLGDLHGGDLARRALESRPALLVVYTSGLTSVAAALEGKPAGDAFLRKPYTADELERMLGSVFAEAGG